MLAVPGSVTFAGEFAILSGAFVAGWGYAVVGAVAIVFAALYGLRLISAVLHQARGPAVRETDRDLSGNELWLVVPLVACLLALSVVAGDGERRTASRNDEPQSATEAQRVIGAHHPDARRRLAGAVAVAGAPARLRPVPARRRSLPARQPSPVLDRRRAHRLRRGRRARGRRVRGHPRRHLAARRLDDARPARRAGTGDPGRDRRPGGARLARRPPARPRRRVLRPRHRGRARGCSSSSPPGT